jgi:transcriptional regulator of heat shock response
MLIYNLSMSDERMYKILEAAIQEFIDQGEPVSSKKIAKKYKFGVKDATIRSEFNKLTEEGFLSQSHTSGGRIPTDKGYQFLANNIAKDFFDSAEIFHQNFNKLINILDDEKWSTFLDKISQDMQLLSAGYRTDEDKVYKTGLNELFEHLEISERDDFCQVAKDFEMLDEKLEKLPSIIDDSSMPKIFIGKKSPVTESKFLSVIIDSYNIDNNKFYLVAIGPKRMDYEKNIKYFRKIKESIKKKKK